MLHLDGINVISPTQLRAAALIIDKAHEHKFDMSEGHIAYNSSSGYIYIYSEYEAYQICITDFAFNRGENVEYLYTDLNTGKEYLADSLKELYRIVKDL